MPRRRTVAVRVGDDVIARDKKCIWYAAKVLDDHARAEGRSGVPPQRSLFKKMRSLL